MTEKIVRYGILSAATIVPRFVKGMRLTSNGEVTAIAARTMSKAESAAKELDIPYVYPDYSALLESNEIDAVYIPLVNSLHYEYAEKALAAGKHVVAEKPFVLHASEAEKLFQTAADKGLFITEAIKTPHLPLYQKIKQIVDSQEYGRIRYMSFRQSYTSGSYTGGWNRKREYGGGVLYGNEAYFFRMAEFLCGKILSCSGTASFPENEAEDQCAVTALLENGSIACLNVSTRVLFKNGLTIYMDHAVIEIPDYWKACEARILPENGSEQILSFPCPYEFRYELEHYNNCILSGKSFSSVNTPEMTIRYIRFCEDLYKGFSEYDESSRRN